MTPTGVASGTPSSSGSSQTAGSTSGTGTAGDTTGTGSTATGGGASTDTPGSTAGSTGTSTTETAGGSTTDTTSGTSTDTTSGTETDATGSATTGGTATDATDDSSTDATGDTGVATDDGTATATDDMTAADDSMMADDSSAADDSMAADDPTDDSTMADDMGAADDSMMADDMGETMPDETPGGVSERPCDIYNAAGNECVAAYSTIRSLRADYDGPLYQVRSGSNPMNTGSGGEVHDIPQTADGYADAAVQDDVCAGTTCTISMMYDHSGRENHLTVAKRGRSDGGEFGDDDDFESIADADPRTFAGHDVYPLYMETRQGYRQTVRGNGMALGQEAQAIYMLADGTHVGSACCWDFGNVTPDPTQYHTMNTLFFGQAYWGAGEGGGPWFMADFEAGVWAGGSNPGDPGWGALSEPAPANPNNPSLAVPFAIGFLKTDRDYALRMADLQADNMLTTAYEGPLPKQMDNQGAVVIGVGGDNSNNSWGTFFEGAVVLGYPADETEQAVMDNVKAAGYQ
jgi:hypothetical protein